MAGGSIWDAPGSKPSSGGSSSGGSIWDAPGGGKSSGPVSAPVRTGGGLYGQGAVPAGKGAGGKSNLASRFVDDLYSMAVNAPGGLYNIGKATVHDALFSPGSPFAGKNAKYELPGMAKGIATQTAQSFEHPLRHPGYTFLNALPAFNAVGKAAEAGALAKEGEIGAAAKSLVTKRAPQPRDVKLPGGKSVPAGFYSRAAGSRVVQKGLDALREKYPNVKIGLRNQYERAGFERSQNERIKASLADAPAKALAASSRGLNKGQLLSIRVVAEGVPLETRITHAQQMLAEAPNPRVANLLKNHLTFLRRARAYVEDTPNGPQFRKGETRLQQLYGRAKNVADTREADLVGAGALNPVTAEARKSAAGDVIQQDLGGTPRPGTQLKLGFNPDNAPEMFNHEGHFYISYRNAKNPKSLGGAVQVGRQDQVGIPQRLSELAHSFEGKNLRAGNVNPNTALQVANDALRSNRLLSVWRQRDELAKLADSAPLTEHHIPIRPVWLKGKPWPADVRDHISGLQQGMEPEADVRGFQKLHDYIFPAKEELASLPPGEASGIKWIDRRILGRQNLPGPLVGVGQHPIAKGVLGKGIDPLNALVRDAYIYARPGHVLTRGANNLFFNLLQQGPKAAVNLARQARISHNLTPEAAQNLDAAMGHGYFHALGNMGPGQKVTAALQGRYERYVDAPFRRSSFLHEAARAGYKTSAQLEKLLTDPAERDMLVRVAREANGEIIDYARMGPIERDVVRRALFIYPWIKGATVYGGKFLRDHPVKAGAIGAAGQQQTARTAKELGPLSSYLAGTFKVGGSSAFPEVVRPTAINQFETPATLLETLKGVLAGNVKQAFKPSAFLNPVLQASEGNQYAKPGTPIWQQMLDQLVSGVPGVALEQRLAHPPSQSAKPHTFPYTREEALMQFLLGSASPHHMNRAQANTSAYKELHPRR